MFLTACSHAGMLAGIAAFKLAVERVPLSSAALRAGDFVSGAATFLVALPAVTAANLVWRWLLEAGGLPLARQDLVGMFTNVRSPLLLALMIGLATVTAPATEEMVFRAGFFRYLRTRIPRWGALVAPSCLFAALHQHLASFAPLVVLGVVFSLAYERTGRIGTTLVAHALFNLHTIALIFAGVGL
jgi:membrane protease YdiL (CAAX protease family)